MADYDDYIIPGSNNILKNKLGIIDQEELTKKENEIVLYKLSLLYLKKEYGKFDVKHLCDIHKYLFEDIYEFAGKFRDVTMFKGISSFCDYWLIEDSLIKVFDKYIDQKVNLSSSFNLAIHLGNFYLELMDIHPFREGNGRSVREFLREYVANKFPDYEIDYSRIDKNNFRLASTNRETYPMLLPYEFYKALVKVNDNVKLDTI